MLNSSQRINPEVKNALKKISHGEIDNEVYKVIYRNQPGEGGGRTRTEDKGSFSS